MFIPLTDSLALLRFGHGGGGAFLAILLLLLAGGAVYALAQSGRSDAAKQ